MILAALKHLFGILERQYRILPQKIECDNEIMRCKAVRTWLENEQHVKIEPSPPYTKELDGAAERSGGVIKDKARAMQQAVKLPAALQLKINHATVYLHNRTPSYRQEIAISTVSHLLGLLRRNSGACLQTAAIQLNERV